jgi:peptidoglycan/xylan/chitin deacetylase (PgdA/CDA1 family)
MAAADAPVVASDSAEALAGPSLVAVDCLDGPPTVVLTYDDGPEPGGTDAVLGALAECGASATFFVLLSRVRRHESLIHDVLASGHEVGLHGPDHRQLVGMDPTDVTSRTRAAKLELEERTGRAVRWFRPPYGRQSALTWRAVADAGLTTVLWTVDCADWLDATHETRMQNVQAMTEPGAVVLLHDGFANDIDGVDDGMAPTLDRGELTRRVIAACGAKGYHCSSLGRALATGSPIERPRPDG